MHNSREQNSSCNKGPVWKNALLDLFNCMPESAFFAKNLSGKFISGDKSFANLLLCKSVDEFLGKTDFDFFPPHIARGYTSDDRQVIQQKAPLLNRIELVPTKKDGMEWRACHKTPLYSEDGEIIGIIGVTSKTELSNQSAQIDPSLLKALEHITTHYSKRITIPELAKISNISVRTFERRFVRSFNRTPSQYIKKIRIDAACHALTHGNLSLSEIALECGFYDQSHMTLEFSRIIHMTPREYRLQNGRKINSDTYIETMKMTEFS